VDRFIALALALGYVVLLLRTTGDLGYSRDEGFYFHAADSYARWFEQLWSAPRAAVGKQAVDTAWGVNNEHPALIKSLFALSNVLLQKKRHLFAMEGTSYRFPAMVLAGIGVAVVYAWGTRARGRTAGLAAALLLAFMPRFFYQSHLACFDVPIVTLWTLCAYCWWRALERGGFAWPLLVGVTFGLALDTKHNSWFLPFACGAHLAVLAARGWLPWMRASRAGAAEQANAGQGSDSLGASAATVLDRRASAQVTRRGVVALACMATIGPLVVWSLWPWIWRDTFARLADYARFHLQHDYYNMEFFGRTYWAPPMPRAYAWVMTAATVPTVTLALAVAGLWLHFRAPIAASIAWARRRARGAAHRASAWSDATGADLFWLIAIAVCYSAWLSPKTPIFGGTKHWMTAYPFLCLFAGSAFAEVVRAARASLLRLRGSPTARARFASVARGPLPELALAAAVLVAPITETIRSHPWGLSSYSPLVGGAAGAATLGLNRSFWGYTTGAVVDYLNREVPQRGAVYVHDTSWPAWQMLLEDGRLRRDIRGVGNVAGADFALYHHEQHMSGQEYQAWVAYGTVRPDHVAGLDGVPVIWIYRRR
jgi:hypothetical protein